jgi:hypothetical protein
VLMVGESVGGLALGSTTRGCLEIESLLVVPSCRIEGTRGGWANLLLLAALVESNRTGKLLSTRFSYLDHNLPMRRLAGRFRAVPTEIEVSFELKLAG